MVPSPTQLVAANGGQGLDALKQKIEALRSRTTTTTPNPTLPAPAKATK